ncbi:unnamed protein product [Closterium sp. NIES-53]
MTQLIWGRGYPVAKQQRRGAQDPELEELQQQIDGLLEKGFIRPSTSPLAAPILFTPKKVGELRMCIDYRALNRVPTKSRYPIPRTDDLLDQLRGARYFSKIDLRGGYHQIWVFTDDCHKTAFRTRYGSYKCTLMPFGLTNVPSTFQLTMNRVFQDLLDFCVIVYLDDILIFSRTREQHLRDLDAVFKRLQENCLITQGSKCEFLKVELEFWGTHVASQEAERVHEVRSSARHQVHEATHKLWVRTTRLYGLVRGGAEIEWPVDRGVGCGEENWKPKR